MNRRKNVVAFVPKPYAIAPKGAPATIIILPVARPQNPRVLLEAMRRLRRRRRATTESPA